MAYELRNFRDQADLDRKRSEFFKYLKLQQKLNKQYEDAVAGRAESQELGIKPVPPQKRSVTEQVADITSQLQIADKNLRTIMDVDEAQKVLDRLRQDTALLQSFNQNFKGIEKALEGKAFLTSDYVFPFIRTYVRQQNRTGGLDITRVELGDGMLDEIRRIARGITGTDPMTGAPYTMADAVQQLSDEYAVSSQDIMNELQRVHDAGAIPPPDSDRVALARERLARLDQLARDTFAQQQQRQGMTRALQRAEGVQAVRRLQTAYRRFKEAQRQAAEAEAQRQVSATRIQRQARVSSFRARFRASLNALRERARQERENIANALDWEAEVGAIVSDVDGAFEASRAGGGAGGEQGGDDQAGDQGGDGGDGGDNQPPPPPSAGATVAQVAIDTPPDRNPFPPEGEEMPQQQQQPDKSSAEIRRTANAMFDMVDQVWSLVRAPKPPTYQQMIEIPLAQYRDGTDPAIGLIAENFNRELNLFNNINEQSRREFHDQLVTYFNRLKPLDVRQTYLDAFRRLRDEEIEPPTPTFGYTPQPEPMGGQNTPPLSPQSPPQQSPSPLPQAQESPLTRQQEQFFQRQGEDSAQSYVKLITSMFRLQGSDFITPTGIMEAVKAGARGGRETILDQIEDLASNTGNPLVFRKSFVDAFGRELERQGANRMAQSEWRTYLLSFLPRRQVLFGDEDETGASAMEFSIGRLEGLQQYQNIEDLQALRDNIPNLALPQIRDLLNTALGDDYTHNLQRSAYGMVGVDLRGIEGNRSYLEQVLDREIAVRRGATAFRQRGASASGGQDESKGKGLPSGNLNQIRYGHSVLLKPRARRIVGKGIQKNSNTYERFGRYLVYIPALRRNVLHLKFPSFVSIPNLPRREISDDLKAFFEDLFENGNINKRLYSHLSETDKRIFNSVASKAQVDETLDISHEVSKQEREEMKRFELVKGIVMAGNNAPEVLQELRDLLIKFSREGKLNHQKVNEIMCDLMVVS